MKEYIGLLIKGIAGFYYVEDQNGNIAECKAKGIFKKRGIVPTVGDIVAVVEEDNGHCTLTEIKERKNHFIRPAVSNIDGMIIVVSEKDPELNLEVLNKFLIMAEKNNIKPLICVNKTELIENKFGLEKIYKGVYPVIRISALRNEGIEELRNIIPDGKIVLAGPSGVGKSTILNKLLRRENAEVGEISHKMKRGKHTTRHVEIYKLDDTRYIFDTPGFTSFELQNIKKDELQDYFPEIAVRKGKCKYSDCMHIAEPNCSVVDETSNGNISISRYENYKKLYYILEKTTDIK